jgi:PAS domain S-box-containing protein
LGGNFIVSVSPLHDSEGKLTGCVHVAHGINERKQAEDALRQSETRYRLLHDSIRDAFVQVTMDGRIIDFNDIYCQMLGYSPQELRTLTYRELTPERWHAIEYLIVREQIIPRGYSDVYEKEYQRKDATIIPVELRTILSYDAAGLPSAMWAIVRDITERKQAEESLRLSEQKFSWLLPTTRPPSR